MDRMSKPKERAPAFQFYPRQFSGDDQVMAMDLDTIGAHILLMCNAAASPERYRIEADDRAIRNRVRNPADRDWKRIKTQLLRGAWKPTADGLWWQQEGLRRVHEKQQAFSEAQRGRAGARWNAERMPDGCRTDAGSDAGAVPKTCSSSSSSSSSFVCGEDLIDAATAVSGLIQLTGIHTQKARVVLDQMAQQVEKEGGDLKAWVERMAEAWQLLESSRPKLEYAWGAEKFFGEGHYKNPAGWPWKPGHNGPRKLKAVSE